MSVESRGFRPLLPATRAWLYVDMFLVFSAGIQLFILTGRTEDFFAWTIGSHLTAATLGGMYWAAILMLHFSARESLWANARGWAPGVLLFTFLTSVATFIHIDVFHTDTVAGWAWISVYIAAPIVIAAVWYLQSRLSGGDPPREMLLSPFARLVFGAIGVVMVAVGVGLFLAPGAFDALWSWPLTPLTGRAVGAWLIGIGVVELQIAWENDWRRSFAVLMSGILIAPLQFTALLRYPDEVSWDSPSAWLYVAFLVLLTGANTFGLFALYRRRAGVALAPAG